MSDEIFKKLPDILTMKEVTEVLRISRNTVVKEIESNNLKAMKFGKQYRFKKCDIMNYISKSTTVNEKEN